MNTNTILFIADQVIFWILIATIAWYGKSAPRWLFTVFTTYMIYYVARLAFGLKGWQRFSAVYVLGLGSVFMIWYYMV
jgi:hypothetical protein